MSLIKVYKQANTAHIHMSISTQFAQRLSIATKPINILISFTELLWPQQIEASKTPISAK